MIPLQRNSSRPRQRPTIEALSPLLLLATCIFGPAATVQDRVHFAFIDYAEPLSLSKLMLVRLLMSHIVLPDHRRQETELR